MSRCCRPRREDDSQYRDQYLIIQLQIVYACDSELELELPVKTRDSESDSVQLRR